MENLNQVRKQISDNVVLLQKMRQEKGISRKQAGMLFNISSKTIEKLENGRGEVSDEKLMKFAVAYGFNLYDIELLRQGRYSEKFLPKADTIFERDPARKSRRFTQRKIKKECKVLRELRERTGIGQCKAGLLCGQNKATIGHIENGRINLTPERIDHILKVYGATRSKFDELMASKDPLPYEMLEECIRILEKLENTKLILVRSMLLTLIEKK